MKSNFAKSKYNWEFIMRLR